LVYMERDLRGTLIDQGSILYQSKMNVEPD